MTQQELSDAFSRFMPRPYGARLAETLLKAPEPAVIDDDEAGALVPEDGSSFGAGGRYLPGVQRTQAEEHANAYYYDDCMLLTLPGSIAYNGWFRNRIKSVMGDGWRGFYNDNMGEPSGRAAVEIAVAVQAVRRAFPGQADVLVRNLVRNNGLYAPFWDEAVKRCPALVKEP